MDSRRLCAALALALLPSIGATGAEHVTDEQVKKVIEDIDTGYDTWKKGLSIDKATRESLKLSIQQIEQWRGIESGTEALAHAFGMPSHGPLPGIDE